MFAFNSSRPLFRNNPRLRRAVNFALDRGALMASAGGRPRARSLTSTSRRPSRGSGTPTSTRSSGPTCARRGSSPRQPPRRQGRPLHDESPPGARAGAAGEAAACARSGSRSSCRPMPITSRPRRTSSGSPSAASRGTSRSSSGRRTSPTRTRTSTCCSRAASSAVPTCAASRRAATTSGCPRRTSPAGQRAQPRLRLAGRAARPRCCAARRAQRRQRGDVRLRPRRLHRVAAGARPGGRLPEVASASLRRLRTQTEPSATARPAGASPTSIVSDDLVRRGVDLRDVPAAVFATQIDAGPTATAVGPSPTGIVKLDPVRRRFASPRRRPGARDPDRAVPTASPAGLRPTVIVCERPAARTPRD